MPQQSLNVTFTITFEGGGLRLTSPPAPTTGKVGVPWTHTFTLDGGVAPYIWQPVSLPPGLVLTPGFGGASCTLSGTPTVPGAVESRLVVRDSGTLGG